ncbi:MAG: FKBP-type peptidyl-prolyl cis-trans isomerase [Proteobacteria bacterium]|nr:FKBP-type peptidyl-prolyl cis-trans isomerase [Pseudomonadota bacterium]
MKRKILLVAVIGTALVGCNQQAAEPAPLPATALDTAEKRVSYGMGIGLGQRIKKETFSIDVDVFAQGVKDAVAGGEQLMTQEEIVTEMQAFQQQQMEAQQTAATQAADTNLADGVAFLAENGVKEGVITTESGLQYEVISAGDGAKPGPTDTVEVHYAGTLLDGTEFDSSYKRGSTVSFPVNGVIPGWTEALQLMPAGSKWRLVIPSELAYGPGGTGGGPIGPNATLIFEVELVGIKDAAAEGGEG